MAALIRGINHNRIYVENLPPSVRIIDVKDLFSKYGNIHDIDLKSGKGGPLSAFVQFQKPSEAKEAVDGRDRHMYRGYRLRVNFSRSWKEHVTPGVVTGRFGPILRRSEHRVLVSGLPYSASWQDLKDFMREAGPVCYANVSRDGTGVVEFLCRDDIKSAVQKLDNTKFRSHLGDISYIRVKMDRSHSPSNGRSLCKSRPHCYTFRRCRASPRHTSPSTQSESHS